MFTFGYEAEIRNEADVLAKNEMARFRYRRMLDRITKFDFD